MRDVLVVGGGIGGLAAGVALQRRGFDAHVYEAVPKLEALGAGIWVPPNAMSVMRSLDLAEPLLRLGLPLARMEVRDSRDGLLQAIEGDGDLEKGLPTVAVRRSDLQSVLVSALRPGTLHTGRRLVGFTAEGATVRAEFADGKEEVGSLLVGADGIHSAVRAVLHPRISLRYSGQTCFRALAPVALSAEMRRTAWEVWGGAARFGFSGVGGDTVYWFAPFTAPAGTRVERVGLKKALADRYAAFPDPVPAVIEATPEEAIYQTDLLDFPPLRGWRRGRVVLLGDAAHAMTPNLGQGGAQALEDAISLATRLESLDDPTPALAEYERIRARRTGRLVRLSWHFGRLAHWEGSVARKMRNIALRATPASAQQRQTENLFSPRL
jgi:2-polyprenyl-6-methoxyphenol hydroxylase-like FAD-dependent oxidoreductase